MPKPGKPWTPNDRRRLAKAIAAGRRFADISSAMNRSRYAIASAVQRFGLEDQNRYWKPWQQAFVAAHYRRARTATIAACLGKSPHAVYLTANRLGLSEKQSTPIRDQHAEFMRLHRLGWSDAEVAAALGVTREGVTEYRSRQKPPLPANGRNERYRRRVAENTKRQCQEAGVASLAEVRVLAFRDFAKRNGWPEDLRPRAVQILNLLYDNGPMTRRQIVAAAGMRWRGSRPSLCSNDPEGSYLANLIARGLVVSLGRIGTVHGKGKGRSVQVYAVPPHVVRGEVEVQDVG